MFLITSVKYNAENNVELMTKLKAAFSPMYDDPNCSKLFIGSRCTNDSNILYSINVLQATYNQAILC